MNVLEVSAKLNIGGAQSVCANISKYAEDSFHFVYIVFGKDEGAYEAQIRSRGDSIIHIPYPSANIVSFIRTLIRIIREEKIDVVHAHTMSNCGIVMFAGWLSGAKGRISHSHTINDEGGNSVLRCMYRAAMRHMIHMFGTDWCACGLDAGNTLYGERWFQKHGTIIRNGIDIEAYQFNVCSRERIRKELGAQNCFIIGNVGHYVEVKNQVFLIRLMPAVLEKKPNAVLLLYGDGEDREKLEAEISALGLTEHVRLMGNVSNISEALSALDVFAFPSLFEGTPLALIEAQANQLPCVISDSVPADACLTDYIAALPLDGPQSDWVYALLSAHRVFSDKENQKLVQYGSIQSTMQTLYELFRKYDSE